MSSHRRRDHIAVIQHGYPVSYHQIRLQQEHHMKLSQLSRYWKTVVSAIATVVAFVSALITDPTVADAVADDRITGGEWRGILLLALSTVFVYAVPNKAPAGQPARRDLSEQG